MKRLIWAVLGCVEFGLEALEGTVSHGLRPDLTPQNVAGLPTGSDVPLLALLKDEFSKGAVSPPSNCASSRNKVELGAELGSSGTNHANNQLDSP